MGLTGVEVRRSGCWLLWLAVAVLQGYGVGRTWDGGGFWQGPEEEFAGIRSSSLVFGYNGDLILRVPLQTLQHNVLATIGQADLWLPILAMFLWMQKWTHFKHRWYIGG